MKLISLGTVSRETKALVPSPYKDEKVFPVRNCDKYKNVSGTWVYQGVVSCFEKALIPPANEKYILLP